MGSERECSACENQFVFKLNCGGAFAVLHGQWKGSGRLPAHATAPAAPLSAGPVPLEGPQHHHGPPDVRWTGQPICRRSGVDKTLTP